MGWRRRILVRAAAAARFVHTQANDTLFHKAVRSFATPCSLGVPTGM